MLILKKKIKCFSKSSFLQLVLFFKLITVFSQNVTISGYVQDESTGEKLINATVHDLYSKKGTLTNNYGFYSITVPLHAETEILVSYVGYRAAYFKPSELENKKNIIFLKRKNFLDEVVVKSSRFMPIEKRNEISTLSIPVEQIKMLPSLGGESDILKAIQLMPGVQSGNEGSSSLYVRGGSPDQNLVLLDDVPLYYVNHLGGFVSIFNTDAINSVKLVKGGFPAKFGTRLSSVLDVRMKDGNMKEFKGNAMIGLLSGKFSFEGPIKKDTTSFFISARRMLYDLITQPLTKLTTDGGASFGYTFYDINAKINHKLTDKDRLYFSLYHGNDKFKLKLKEKDSEDKVLVKNRMIWGNSLAALRWNHQYNSKLFSNLTIAYTRYRFLTKFDGNFEKENDKSKVFRSFRSGIYDLSGKIDFEYFSNPNYKIKFGTGLTNHKFVPSVEQINRKGESISQVDTIFGSKNIYALDFFAYAENEFKLGNKFSGNLGLRYSMYHINGKSFNDIQPRLLFNYQLSDKSSVKASFASMQQSVHLLANSSVGLPTDLWLPATKKVAPQKSSQITLGFFKSLSNRKYELSIEAYYKKMKNLISYKEGANYTSNSIDWQDKVETNGVGKSFGLELLIQKRQGKSTGWIGYTLSKSTRTFEKINLGKEYPFKYDRRHDISLVYNYRIKENIDFSATWMFGTGNAITLGTGKYRVIDNYYNTPINNQNIGNNTTNIDVYEDKNNFRMRSFHRLDIGFNFRKRKKRGIRTWNVSVFNLYNRQNPYFYFFDNKQGTENGLVLKQQSLFPILPSFSYSYSF